MKQNQFINKSLVSKEVIYIILINDIWEQINDMYDAIRVIKENINDEFAMEVQNLFNDLQYQVSDLKEELVALEKEFNDYDDISDDLEHMKDKLDNLRCYIDDYEDGSDFMKGMKYACGLMER